MTATSTTVDVSSFTTDAKWQAWVTAVSNCIQASGLTKTTDTGQIVPGSATRPTSASVVGGYEIYRYNDSLQASKPIFIRVEYRSGANASGQNQSLGLQVGTGTDGAGNLSGVGLPPTVMGGTSSLASTNTAMTVGAAYSTAAGAVTIIGGLLNVTTNHSGVFVIARTCDTSGNPDGNGVNVSWTTTTGNASPSSRGATFSPATQAAATNPGCGVPQPLASVASGGVFPYYKNYAILGTMFPLMGLLSYFGTDVVAMSTFTAAPFGSTLRTYLALGSGNATGFDGSHSNTILPAVIWE